MEAANARGTRRALADGAKTRRLLALTTRPEFWLACLLAWLLLSAGRSLGTPWARAALSEALRWGAGLGLALTLGLTLRRTDLGARLATVAAGLLALAGVFGGLQPSQGGMTGPYHDHQLYGSALLILLPLPAALALVSRVPAWRWGGLAVAVGGAVCLVLSETRGAWAGAVAALLVFAGLWLSRSGRREVVRRDGRRVLIPLLLLLGMAGAFWATADSGLRGPLAQRAGTMTFLMGDGSWQGRLADWRGAALLVAERPLAGIGLGRYPARQSAWADGGLTLGPDARPSLSEEAHSFYLQTAAETGLVGLGLYAAALVTFATQALRGLRRSRGRGSAGRAALLIAALSMAAGQAVDALVSPSWQFAETSLLFWALFGLGLAALRRPEAEEASAPAHPSWRHAAAGLAAVALAANVLPVGLLTPVEAYTPPGDYVFHSLTIQGSAVSVTAPATVTYTLTAHYTEGLGGPPRDVDVTLDPYPAKPSTYSMAGNCPQGNCHGYSPSSFGAAGSSTRNVLTVSEGDSGRTLTVSGKFTDPKIGTPSPIPVQLVVK